MRPWKDVVFAALIIALISYILHQQGEIRIAHQVAILAALTGLAGVVLAFWRK
jgi:hypothetical protein